MPHQAGSLTDHKFVKMNPDTGEVYWTATLPGRQAGPSYLRAGRRYIPCAVYDAEETNFDLSVVTVDEDEGRVINQSAVVLPALLRDPNTQEVYLNGPGEENENYVIDWPPSARLADNPIGFSFFGTDMHLGYINKGGTLRTVLWYDSGAKLYMIPVWLYGSRMVAIDPTDGSVIWDKDGSESWPGELNSYHPFLIHNGKLLAHFERWVYSGWSYPWIREIAPFRNWFLFLDENGDPFSQLDPPPYPDWIVPQVGEGIEAGDYECLEDELGRTTGELEIHAEPNWGAWKERLRGEMISHTAGLETTQSFQSVPFEHYHGYRTYNILNGSQMKEAVVENRVNVITIDDVQNWRFWSGEGQLNVGESGDPIPYPDLADGEEFFFIGRIYIAWTPEDTVTCVNETVIPNVPVVHDVPGVILADPDAPFGGVYNNVSLRDSWVTSPEEPLPPPHEMGADGQKWGFGFGWIWKRTPKEVTASKLLPWEHYKAAAKDGKIYFTGGRNIWEDPI